MAASSTGRVLSLCKQFQNVCRISSQINVKKCATLTSLNSYLCREKSPLVGRCWYNLSSPVLPCRSLHTTVNRRGLDEFFDLPENWGESRVKSGESKWETGKTDVCACQCPYTGISPRWNVSFVYDHAAGAPWTAKQLRAKSSEDLHKLWYVLLKEKNMLLTLQQESRRQRLQMPSPERIRKVERSMIRLETVVKERETSLRLLQTGQERGRPGAWRRNVFGFTYWYRFKEYAIPWYMNRRYKRKRFYTPYFVEPHIRLRIEKYMRAQCRKSNMEKKKLAKLQERFPQMKVPAS
ncbi:39S ribosomal protein L47, mitochondrial isoform X1 [Dunckerocampus dactyliophorus]|uniref:39S ribosomal protein L47, mitochondrial isoform X1 n=1 Tax=Dunckerocampus dactyliophorus TaxID=161453 RepID=UPI002406BFB5|nr:39S ribosomal protein L47, mitochondrial isoform X1 [Dunckerocampus dactyliophorus]